MEQLFSPPSLNLKPACAAAVTVLVKAPSETLLAPPHFQVLVPAALEQSVEILVCLQVLGVLGALKF